MTLQQLEETVKHLPPDELARFRNWFLEFDSDLWDSRVESDADSGQLDVLADTAIAEHRAGRTKPL
jgi:hypothetical protein